MKLWGRTMNLDYLLKISFAVHGLIQLEDILYPELIYFFPKVYNYEFYFLFKLIISKEDNSLQFSVSFTDQVKLACIYLLKVNSEKH